MKTVITVLESVRVEKDLEKNKFLCEVNVDNETIFEQYNTLKELYEFWNNKKQYKVIFQTEVKFNTVSIEEYEGEFDVNANTYTLNEDGESFQDNLIGTWKRNSTAISKANEYAKYNGALEIISAAM